MSTSRVSCFALAFRLLAEERTGGPVSRYKMPKDYNPKSKIVFIIALCELSSLCLITAPAERSAVWWCWWFNRKSVLIASCMCSF